MALAVPQITNPLTSRATCKVIMCRQASTLTGSIKAGRNFTEVVENLVARSALVTAGIVTGFVDPVLPQWKRIDPVVGRR